MNNRRPGISLLEVLIATGMLFGSLVVLSQLAFVGRRHLDRAEESATAARLCQNKLGEVLAGILPLEPVEDESIESDPEWSYSIDIRPTEELGLVEVRVQVYYLPENEPKSDLHKSRFTLVRWVYPADRQSVPSPGERPFQDNQPDTLGPSFENASSAAVGRLAHGVVN